MDDRRPRLGRADRGFGDLLGRHRQVRRHRGRRDRAGDGAGDNDFAFAHGIPRGCSRLWPRTVREAKCDLRPPLPLGLPLGEGSGVRGPSLSRKANAIRPRVRARGPGVGDEFRRVAIEIEHEAVERDLPPKFGAIEARPAQALPSVSRVWRGSDRSSSSQRWASPRASIRIARALTAGLRRASDASAKRASVDGAVALSQARDHPRRERRSDWRPPDARSHREKARLSDRSG